MNKYWYKITGLIRFYLCEKCGRFKIETNSHAEVCSDCYHWNYYWSGTS